MNLNVAGLDLANPFSFATVVVADEYVDTFPHPQGLLSYLHRLCSQLDVDIVSLDRPVTVKGSWKTIIKIDAFLKTLISTLHSAISKGAVPSEEDFSAAFSHFEEENIYRSEPLENKQEKLGANAVSEFVQVQQDQVASEIVEENYGDDPQYLEVPHGSNSDEHLIVHDRWYFNANPRGKFVDKKKRSVSKSGKAPPEPFVIMETDDSTKVSQSDLSQIEKVLSQVYKKETIKKYQKKNVNNMPGGEDKILSPSEKMVTIKQESGGSGTDNRLELPETESELPKKTDSVKKSNIASSINNGIVDKTLEKGKVHKNNLTFLKRSRGILKEGVCSTHDETEQQATTSKHQRKSLRLKDGRTKGGVSITESQQLPDNETKKEKLQAHRKAPRDDTSTQKTNKETSQKPITIRGKERKQTVKKDASKDVSKKEEKGVSKKEEKDVSKKEEKDVSKKEEKDVSKKEEKDVSELDQSVVERPKRFKKYSHENNKKTIKLKRSPQKKEVSGDLHACNQCSYVSAKRAQLMDHTRRVHLTQKFTCLECQKEFGYKKDLKRHMLCHAKPENCCDQCGKMYKEARKLNEHKKIHADNYVKPDFPCQFCGKSFSTKYVLAYHLKSEHLGMKRSYLCPTCGKSFSQKNSYIQHANVHLGIKPHTCEICGKRFSYEKSLKEHQFMHKDDKLFTCGICYKSFRQDAGLKIHMKIHKEGRDYVCSMCGKGFTQKHALERHERIHNNEKPYECGICNRKCTDSSVLRRHMIHIHHKHPKSWKENMICHLQKKKDFYITVLNGSDTDTESQEQKSEPQEHQLQSEVQSLTYEQQLSDKPEQSISQPTQPNGTEIADDKSIYHISVSEKNDESEVLDGNAAASCLAGNYSEVSYVDVKPYSGYSGTADMATSVSVSENHSLEPPMFSPNALQNHHNPPLQMANTASQTQGMDIVTEQAPAVAATQLPPATQVSSMSISNVSNAASFVPISYQQRSLGYDNVTHQQVQQYTTMIAQQTPPTIVVVQDSAGAITYHQCHQPGVSVSFPSILTSENFQFQPLNQMSASTLLSPPIPTLTEISQPATTVSSGYSNILSSTHQQQQ